jgi:hypothetical protein
MSKPFAIVTGASSGIGLELAAICAQDNTGGSLSPVPQRNRSPKGGAGIR